MNVFGGWKKIPFFFNFEHEIFVRKILRKCVIIIVKDIVLFQL